MVGWTDNDLLAYQVRQGKAPKPGTPDPELDDEAAFHEELIAYLKANGVRAIVHSRTDQPTTQQVGVPDLLCAYQGVPIAMEAKVKGRKPTPAQLGWLKALELDGWVTGVVRSMADAAAILEMARKRNEKTDEH